MKAKCNLYWIHIKFLYIYRLYPVSFCAGMSDGSNYLIQAIRSLPLIYLSLPVSFLENVEWDISFDVDANNDQRKSYGSELTQALRLKVFINLFFGDIYIYILLYASIETRVAMLIGILAFS